MQSIQHSRAKDRDISKFYEKIRSQIHDLDLEQDNQSATRSSNDRSSDSSEERIYGEITKDEFMKILDAYSQQQNSNDLKNKPVICNSVVGGSFAKLLYSKPGFHFFGSTALLAKDLSVQNLYRRSLLGGIVTHCLSRGEDIRGLRKNYDRMLIKDISRKACEFLTTGQPELALHEINRAKKIDSRNPDYLVALGEYNLATKNFPDAIECFFNAVNSEPDDIIGVQKSLSDACYQGAMAMYHRQDYPSALNLFGQAMKYDGQNEGARLHYRMCKDRINSRVLFNKQETYRR